MRRTGSSGVFFAVGSAAGSCPAGKSLLALASGRYVAWMGHGPSARHQGWRVTSGEPDPVTVERLQQENVYLRQEVKVLYHHEQIIGQSRAIKQVLAPGKPRAR